MERSTTSSTSERARSIESWKIPGMDGTAIRSCTALPYEYRVDQVLRRKLMLLDQTPQLSFFLSLLGRYSGNPISPLF